MIQREIQESAFRAQRAIDSGESPVVGVTKFQTGEGATIPTFSVDPEIERVQQARVAAVRAARDAATWRASLDAIRDAARGDDESRAARHRRGPMPTRRSEKSRIRYERCSASIAKRHLT